MSDIDISLEDLAQCEAIAAKAATEVASCAMAEAISQARARVAAQHTEAEARQIAEEAEAAKRAEEEAETRRVAEEAEAARRAEEEAEATRRADANAMATSSFSEMNFPMATPEDLALPFSTLDTSTAPPSPIPGEEDELIEETIPPKLDLSTVAAGKRKAAPKPPTTFVPVSKCHKYIGGVEVITSPEKVTPQPESAIMDPAKAKASKSSKASKGSSKAAGTKPVKHTPKEIPQLVSNEPINIELLTNNLLELIQHFGARACTNCISQGRECIFHGFGLKCGACASVSTSHYTFSIPPPNTEFALSVAHCVGNSSIIGLNHACRALDVSRTRAYRASLAAELEQVELVLPLAQL
ncbi:hypothetical protein BDQ17DRAFT_1332888 [Cyathus striatus]|nr:hypothetical protein BDQ17DRAFT_1332888 [Cyathus striatus]